MADAVVTKAAAEIDDAVNDIYEPDRLAVKAQIDIAKKSGESRCVYLSPIPDVILSELQSEGYTVDEKENAANPSYIHIISWGDKDDGTVEQDRVDNISATFELPQDI